MKERLLEILACPGCRARLELRDAVRDADGIRSGTLACTACGAAHPVRDHVPRFVETDRYVDSFSFQWNYFHDVQIDILNATRESEETFGAKTGFTPGELRGRLVLDAGVGAGRFAEVASRWGAEVVGIDLSYAVEAAYRTVGRRPNVHVVQADLFRPPLPPERFDAAYSIGVLHHTPDTRRAFMSLVPLLRRGAPLAVFVYGRAPSNHCSDLYRRLTVRLPAPLLSRLCWVAVPLYHLHRLPLAGRLLQQVLPISMHPRARWRWLDTFDWYSPRYQWKHTWPEVFGWFRDGGFRDVELFEHPICMRGTRA